GGDEDAVEVGLGGEQARHGVRPAVGGEVAVRDGRHGQPLLGEDVPPPGHAVHGHAHVGGPGDRADDAAPGRDELRGGQARAAVVVDVDVGVHVGLGVHGAAQVDDGDGAVPQHPGQVRAVRLDDDEGAVDVAAV